MTIITDSDRARIAANPALAWPQGRYQRAAYAGGGR